MKFVWNEGDIEFNNLSLERIIESLVARQAKMLGLVYAGFGRWKNPQTGKVTHKSKNGVLYALSDKEKEIQSTTGFWVGQEKPKISSYEKFERKSEKSRIGALKRYFKKQTEVFFSPSISPEHRNAVRSYCGSAFESINKHLRKGKNTHYFDVIEKINELFEKTIPTKRRFVVWRGVGNSDIFNDMRNSKEFIDKGFVSTTLKEHTAMEFASGSIESSELVRIEIPHGSRVIPVNHNQLSSHSEEHEVLLPAGSRFKVIGETKKMGHEMGFHGYGKNREFIILTVRLIPK